MLDAKSILDQIMGAAGGPAGPGSSQRHSGQRPSQSGSGDILGQVQDLARGNLGGLAGGAILGSLASVLLGGARKGGGPQISPGAMNLGGLAILGGLAYKAWRNYQETQQGAAGRTAPPPPPAAPIQVSAPPAQTPFSPGAPADEQKLGELLIRAMIAAARADGRIDGEEVAKIREGLKAAGAGDDQAELIQLLGRSDDLDAIAAEAKGPEIASEVWLAARLAIDPDAPAEQAFLKRFADKLGLDDGLVQHLEATAAQARTSGVEAA